MKLLSQFLRYASSTFLLPQLLAPVRAHRHPARAQIPTHSALLAWILGFVARVHSREELGRLLDRPALHRLTGRHISADSLARIAAQLDHDSLRTQLLVPLIRRMRRNKLWSPGSVGPFVMVAIDGSEPFHTPHRHCAACLSRTRADGQTEYYHRVVVASIVGTHPRILLDLEPVQRGESEVAAAGRLVDRLANAFPWVHVFLLDAGFAQGPFLAQIDRLGRGFIVRVKDQERRLLLRDAQALAARSQPARWVTSWGHRRLRVQAWDEDHFTSWDSYPGALRVLIVDEEELPEPATRRRQTPFPGRLRPRAFYATNLSPGQLPTRALWEAAHHRWNLENTGFHQLKHEFHWNHPFAHQSPEALLSTWLLLAVAFNLFLTFVYRRLRMARQGEKPARWFAGELYAALRVAPAELLPYLAAG
ncbi:transposase [Caldinitratiruptor microaerophilus]|uniref:Transposase IS4-like domain-containing protein n=1 Tax=Caldinitratiruptor microaerophilus TaxID=671077 RepID=A0AA35G5P9_9FIRM|nr:transposase [Caldinitratiruptor microaerophilus]BDG59866.1 hypothetical protein caldi_09560 [Caldinitratiruptor microaerophilus]